MMESVRFHYNKNFDRIFERQMLSKIAPFLHKKVILVWALKWYE